MTRLRAVAAIILAAGRARRFEAGADDSKVLAELAGKSLVRHVAEAAPREGGRGLNDPPPALTAAVKVVRARPPARMRVST